MRWPMVVLAALCILIGLTAPKLGVIRWGFIGIGHRGLSMLKETLLLEGCEIIALSDPDEAALRRLIPLHTKGFNYITRTPLAARVRGSNLMAHILDTLQQAAQSQQAKAVPGALGPVGARVVYISGHDGNLCNLGSILNLHWEADGIVDDTPPDSQIVFELWQNLKSKQYSVRLLFRAQTLNQLRTLQALTLAQRFECRTIEWSARHSIAADLLFNCTPVGMHPNVDESPVHKGFFRPGMLVFDTVYNPESTMLVKDTLPGLMDAGMAAEHMRDNRFAMRRMRVGILLMAPAKGESWTERSPKLRRWRQLV